MSPTPPRRDRARVARTRRTLRTGGVHARACTRVCRRSRLRHARRAPAAARRCARARRGRARGSVAPHGGGCRRRARARPDPAGPTTRCRDHAADRDGRARRRAGRIPPRPARPARARRPARGSAGPGDLVVRARRTGTGARVPGRARGPPAGDRAAARPLPRTGATHARAVGPRDGIRVRARVPPRRRRAADQLARDVTHGPAHEQSVPRRTRPRHRLRARCRPAHGCAHRQAHPAGRGCRRRHRSRVRRRRCRRPDRAGRVRSRDPPPVDDAAPRCPRGRAGDPRCRTSPRRQRLRPCVPRGERRQAWPRHRVHRSGGRSRGAILARGGSGADPAPRGHRRVGHRPGFATRDGARAVEHRARSTELPSPSTCWRRARASRPACAAPAPSCSKRHPPGWAKRAWARTSG